MSVAPFVEAHSLYLLTRCNATPVVRNNLTIFYCNNDKYWYVIQVIETDQEAHAETGSAKEVMALRAENITLRNEIKELRARFSELEVIADTDTLTPLPNRRCFLRELDRVLRHVARYHSEAAVLYVDVDGLKQINDQFGHNSGDATLIHVAQVLRSTLRSTDLVARIGGDEFGLLLDPIQEEALLPKIAQLSELIRSSPMTNGSDKFPVEISVGYTMIQADDDISSVLRRADDSMYGEKQAHRSAR